MNVSNPSAPVIAGKRSSVDEVNTLHPSSADADMNSVDIQVGLRPTIHLRNSSCAFLAIRHRAPLREADTYGWFL